jgi:broad specificity phosphatase PhoE
VGDIILVKHGDPAILPGDVPSGWSLSPLGRRRCEELVDRLDAYRPSRVVCSDEPKAIETAEVVGSRFGKPVLLDSGLRENERTGVPFYEDTSEFDRRIRDFFRRPSDLVLGLETADEAHSRFVTALHRVCDAESEEPVVVVSHGAVISLLVSRANDLNTYTFWSGLGFTSFAVLATPSFALKEIVHAEDLRPRMSL